MTAQYQGVWSLQSAAQLQSTQRWVTDPLYKSTTLLLQADDAANGAQNNTFLDSSSNSFAITRNGNTTQGSFTPFSQAPGWWGINFNRGYLSSTLTGQAAGTGSFTYEFFFWVNVKDAPINNVAALFNTRSGGGGADGIDCQITTNGAVLVGTSAATLFTSSNGLVADNTWYHLAVVRNGSTNCTVYLNGRSIGTYTAATNYTSTNLYLGVFGGLNDWFKGYISNFRYTRDAVYTSDFTVSTTPLTALPNTQFLTAQANRYLDASANAFAVTTVAANGGTSIQSFSPFAPQFQWTPSVIGGSGYFDGTGDYLSNSSDIIIPNTGDFTAQFWIYPTQVSSLQYLIATTNNTGNKLHLYINSSAYVGVQTGGAFRDSSTTKVVANAWNHIACTRTGSTYALFVNGVSQSISGSGTMASTLDVTPTYIAARDAGNGAVSGYLGSSRITTVVETISIPTAPYTSDANTRLLLNFTNAGIYDGTMKNNLETVGNAQVSTAVVKYGSGSMFFDGTGDYLISSESNICAFGLGDFTIEFWLYLNTTSGTQNLIDPRPASTTGAYTSLYTSSGTIKLFTQTTDRITSSAVNTNVWFHVALCRSGTSTRMFFNGIQTGSTYTDTNNYVSSRLVIGAGFANTASITNTMNGYIDDLRITRFARYTQNFIPPSVALPRQ
jgi:hypothetical protein